MEKFFVGFEKRLEETEKTAMAQKIIGGVKAIASRVANYFNRGVPKAVRNAQSGGANLTRVYPGIDAHRMRVPTTAPKVKQPLKVRSNPKPAPPLDYVRINQRLPSAERVLNYSTFR